MSYESIRRTVRSLESRIDAALTSSSSTDLEAAAGTGSGSAHSVPALLADLRRCNSQLSASLGTHPSAAQLAAVRRHHEVVEDYEREWARVEKRRDRRDVLEGVRGDISAYKSRQATAEASLLNERDRISNSHSMIDSSLEQAYATRANLAQQRSVIQNATSRLQSTAAQIPGLNTIITRINRRRKRDSVIMGCVLGACALLLLWRWFG
ncbi:V-snare-domain-containing protein [Ceraceosorus guamensis]|uniref:V-snare-domain-containing protein n=1 Tax=Ceraceosorus guamensis TaxID=1522189 RepID=A0A316W3H6_9BASI|nr:V-snare-domain-containing protein [Ceraceosorus guamensis]PWN44259.1 V-snare-domain-containing protein [Ceraceosorus guamensis]